MATKVFTTEELTTRWEDLREIENLMGRRSFYELQQEAERRFYEHWSSRSDICMGFNNGYYKGFEAVKAYYDARREFTALKSELVCKAYPERTANKSAEEAYGIGTLKTDNLTTVLIELAEDGQTAKGLWATMGWDIDIYSSGPQAWWSWGRIGVDFIREDGAWRIWHQVYAEDMRTVMGTDWTNEHVPFAEDERFARIKDFALPAPNVPQTVYERYGKKRNLNQFPEAPVSYRTFSETFSYGV